MFSFGLFYLSGITWMNRHTPDAYRTSGQTMYMLVGGTAAAIGHPLGGALFDKLGLENIEYLFWAGSFMMALSIVAFLQVGRVPVTDPSPVVSMPRDANSEF